MTKTVESPARADEIEDMKVVADHARRRYDLYKAKSYSSRASSPTRLRELQRTSERASSRLKRARDDA